MTCNSNRKRQANYNTPIENGVRDLLGAVGRNFRVERRVLWDGSRLLGEDDGGGKAARGHHHHLDLNRVGERRLTLVRGPRRQLEGLDVGLEEGRGGRGRKE